jgi:hypothetical protein
VIKEQMPNSKCTIWIDTDHRDRRLKKGTMSQSVAILRLVEDAAVHSKLTKEAIANPEERLASWNSRSAVLIRSPVPFGRSATGVRYRQDSSHVSQIYAKLAT